MSSFGGAHHVRPARRTEGASPLLSQCFRSVPSARIIDVMQSTARFQLTYLYLFLMKWYYCTFYSHVPSEVWKFLVCVGHCAVFFRSFKDFSGGLFKVPLNNQVPRSNNTYIIKHGFGFRRTGIVKLRIRSSWLSTTWLIPKMGKVAERSRRGWSVCVISCAARNIFVRRISLKRYPVLCKLRSNNAL